MVTPKTIRENDYTFMQDPYGGGGDSWGWRKRRVRRGRVSLTQYLEFQEDQDMIGLFNFLEFKRREEKRRGFCVPWNEGEGWGLYSSSGGIWKEDHLMRVDEESWT